MISIVRSVISELSFLELIIKLIYSTRHKAKDTMSAYILIVSESDKQFEALTKET